MLAFAHLPTSPTSLPAPHPLCPAVDRKATPFVIVFFHASIYHSYVQQYMQADTLRTVMEPLFVKHGVDLVFAGHVHRYARGLAGQPGRGVWRQVPVPVPVLLLHCACSAPGSLAGRLLCG